MQLPGPALLQYPQLNLTEKITGNSVTIAAGDTQPLTWDTQGNGATLLNLAAPAAPTVLVSGIYSATVIISPISGLTVGANYTGDLFLGAGGVGVPRPEALGSAPAATATVNILRLCLTGPTCFIAAGDAISCLVTNNDSGSKSFEIAGATIARIL